MIGRRVGVYELRREIGRGGMGAVYLAERVDGEFRQTVAIKLIKRGMDTDLILKRFRRERQIIAALEHPNIAHFLAGGSTADGLPYFVMEFIDGKPLYQFCDENKLGIEDRLKIFRQICDAVETAHKNKVIHRDLKPSNILVKKDGTPKLLDFGIAKVLDPDLAVTDIDPTATAMRVMTPEYASPEQVLGDEISPASDIYSLGVILYEMLTGHRPYKLKRQIPHEVARIISEEMPSRPSRPNADSEMQISTLEYISKNSTLALEIQNSKFKIQNLKFEGLDKIVLKALRKNASERYESAAAFAEDVNNFLENRPVKAEDFHSETKEDQIKRAGKISVAILPFKVVGAEKSKNTDDIFLGVGLADALVSRLSAVNRLIVRPTSSVLPLAGNEPVEAGKITGVAFVLDGNIRRVGERIRVTVQLLNVEQGSTVWAEKFDENFTDVLELEDVISEKVAKVLLPQLTGEEKRRLERRGTNNTEAYQAYMRGRYFANQFTDESLLKAVEEYKKAVELDPDYAMPHIGLADFYVWSAIFGEMPGDKAYPLAKQSIERALRTVEHSGRISLGSDESSGEAYAILAFITLVYDRNWAEAERLVKRALELNANYYFAHECYSNFFASQGFFERAGQEIRRAEELDPLSPRAKLMTAWIFLQSRLFSESLVKAEQANEMQTDFPQGFLHYGNALAHTGRTREAVEALQKCVALWNSALAKSLLCYALAADGQFDEAEKVLAEMLEAAETSFVKPYFIATAYAAVGDSENAFVWFEKALETNDEWMTWFGVEPKFDELRKDDRYLKILKRTKNSIYERQAQIATGETETQKTEKSIAALPFKILASGSSNSEEDEYLSVGLADALTMRLSNVRRFLVRPTSSVLAFGASEVEPFFAGQKLGVDFVIDGNIRRVGDRIRVAVQLLNVSENSTHWAERFDEKYTDVLALEDSISERVTKSLLPKLTGEEQRRLGKRGTNSPEAYEAYMHARFYWNQFTPESFPKVITALEKAVAIDANYAQAHAAIADFYNWATIYGFFRSNESAPKVLAAANRALEIDDSLAEAYAALGLYYSTRHEHEKALESYRRALKLAPNYSLAHEWLGSTLTGIGNFTEGVKEINLAEQLDPFSLRAKTLTAWIKYQAGEIDAAYEKGKEIIALDANYPQGYLQTGNAALELGFIKEAVENCEKAVAMMSVSPLPVFTYCFALAADGQMEKARTVVERLVERSKTSYVTPYFLAMAHVAIGENDPAFEYFEKAFEENNQWLLWIGTEPKLKEIRKEERFLNLFRQSGNPIFK